MPKHKIYFATQNDFKVAEVRAIMSEFGITVEKLDLEKDHITPATIHIAGGRDAIHCRIHSHAAPGRK